MGVATRRNLAEHIPQLEVNVAGPSATVFSQIAAGSSAVAVLESAPCRCGQIRAISDFIVQFSATWRP